MYTVGLSYTRNDIYDLLGISDDKRGGDWLNGYHRHESDYYVFCNVGVAGRTGHDYDNHWEGERLVWHGKTRSHFAQSTIQNLVSGGHRVLVFYRDENSAPFTFAGIGTAIPHHSVEEHAGDKHLAVLVWLTFYPDCRLEMAPVTLPSFSLSKDALKRNTFLLDCDSCRWHNYI